MAQENSSLKKIIKTVGNKYLLSFIILIVWMAFFDDADFITQYHRLNSLKQLQKKAAYYAQEIEQAKLDLTDIESNNLTIEKFAREQYLMKKEGEDIYVIERTDSVTNKP